MKRYGGLVLACGVTGLASFLGCAEAEKVDPVAFRDGLYPDGDVDAGKKSDEPPSKKVTGPADDKGKDKDKTPTDDDDDDDDSVGVSSSTSGAASSSTSSSSGGASSSSTSGSASSSSSSSGASSSSSSSSSGSTSSSGGSSSSSSGSTPPPSGPVSCDTTSVCTSGTGSFNLGYVSGDSGADVLKATGYASHWIKVRVGEDSWGGSSLRMRATLTSPPGANFDLFLHRATCATPDSKSEKLTGDDIVSVSRPDATLGDDDYYVLLEVRHIGTETCDTGAKWSLKVEGNR